jgi:hypothetical protein
MEEAERPVRRPTHGRRFTPRAFPAQVTCIEQHRRKAILDERNDRPEPCPSPGRRGSIRA